MLDAAYALEQAIGFDDSPARDVSDGASYEPVIGLEIHVQLATRTKMFCGCELSFGDAPNTHTLPGVPRACPARCRCQRRGGPHGLMIGMALGCEIAPRSIFHRKNYFYPDLPKGYQISQYDEPALPRAGALGDVRIHRVHMEEDAAKIVHAGASGPDPRLRRLGRRPQPRRHAAGRDRHRARPARGRGGRRVAAALRATLRQLGVNDVNMEEGSLRCDANVSIRPAAATSSAPRPS